MLRTRRNIEMDKINSMMNGICLSASCFAFSRQIVSDSKELMQACAFEPNWIRHPVLHLHSYESMARIKRARKRNTKLQKDEASSEAFLLQLLGAA